MFTKSNFGILALSVLSVSEGVVGRMRWLERDGRALHLNPRRFGQEHPAVIDKLSAACPGQVCGNLAGAAITPLLAAQGECTQQDMADQIIDAAQQFDDATKANMIALAVEYRQAEKNTPPDFTTNPPTNRNSVFCQTAPKNAELNGLVQAQDPANDPNIFFDPATKASVTLGSQANTFPLGSSGSSGAANASSTADDAAAAAPTVQQAAVDTATAGACVTTVTVTVGTDSAASTTAAAPVATASAVASGSGNIGDFGSCSVPQIEFGVGFDNRKETSFQPVDKTSFNHGSAQAIGIITQFICDTLTNSCGADQTAKDTCAAAQAAAQTGAAKTGVQADLFNAEFGITTNFAAVTAIDDQGRPVAGTGSGAADASTASSGSAADTGAAATTDAAPAATSAAAGGAADTGAAAGGIGDFGSCSVPQIEFGVGFDNRKETSFEPVDKTSFNHGSAQAIGIITQFICDTLTNSCGADQTAKDTCAAAQAAAQTGAAKTGEQADLFNAKFGITTNFAAVTAIDDQGRPVAGTGSGAADAGAADSGAANSGAANSGAANTTAAAAASTGAADNASSGAAAGGIGDFGSCSVPQIEFGAGFDNRKETSFEPVDKASFNHGSAQAIGIITQFICDTLTNSCGADQTAKDTCAAAQAAAQTGTAKTGEQADLFNAKFGITTNFASVTPIDDQGRVVA
ncbi:hypothetical protein K435DRAFT_815603 [Dendrothele bispora CBS 962.96]|uniref:Uncharacterized protein n=1 Tax=Dendrothele bispora (strain CBS 962.96) TaxID=1314807 RepID=A0A4S8MWJ4_DENBC|nr:hypothetical protein K435DRAFT_815603 [Dendrothele bispora CBS 962.96]